MELFEGIITRRSVRKFTNQPVPDDIVEKVLTAAMHAPSGRNMQSWHFVVINDRKILDQIAADWTNAEMANQVSLAIAVCADEQIQPIEPAWAINCSNATMNLWLAVHSLGLAAVWCGLYPNQERQQGISSLLKLPETIKPFALVPIGYAAETPEPGERYRPDRIHYNQW
jgi:nitroreductase